jgi:NAD(P)-dependent dehydrogenase (short-subunit alcohol dehydrogenase family)
MAEIPRKIVITGASRGIGKELAYKYATRGAEIVLMARSTEDLAEVAEEVSIRGGKAHYITCDVSDRDDVRKAFDFAKEKLRNFDIVFLNAGVGGQNWFAEGDVSKFDQIIKVNVLGLAYGMENVVPLMIKRGRGKIAITSSLADSRGFPGNGAYCSSKAAASHLAESARAELRPYGIDVLTIKPGFIKTEMTDSNDFYMPFLMEADEAAGHIANKIEEGKNHIYFPAPTMIASALGKCIPDPIFDFFVKIRKTPIMK